jgi:hypothetical protein
MKSIGMIEVINSISIAKWDYEHSVHSPAHCFVVDSLF